jgi:4-hydroxybenzoate polyprenyltransferase
MGFLSYFNSFRKLIRLNGSLISSAISAILSYFVFADVGNAFLIGAAIFFTISFGFATNDYFDHEKDSSFPEKHVIASGEMTRGQVGQISLVMFVSSIIVTFFLPAFQQLINAVLLLILAVYSFVNNRFGISANILVAICSSLSILIAQPGIYISIVSYSSISVFFFIFGREVIKDIHDMDADARVNKTSFPLLFNARTSFVAAIILTAISLVFCVFTGIYFNNTLYILIVLVAHALYILFVVRYMKTMSHSRYKEFSRYSKISFLLLVPAVIISYL